MSGGGSMSDVMRQAVVAVSVARMWEREEADPTSWVQLLTPEQMALAHWQAWQRAGVLLVIALVSAAKGARA